MILLSLQLQLWTIELLSERIYVAKLCSLEIVVPVLKQNYQLVIV